MKDYPSMLPHRKRSALPEGVQRRLRAMHRLLCKGQMRDSVVRAAVAALSSLSAETCLAAPGEICDLALPYYVERTWFRQVRALDYRSLLASHPLLAHIYLFHRDGHMREAALRTSGIFELTPFWLTAIALRLNDWVPQVRQAAYNSLTEALPQTHLIVLIDVAAHLLPKRWQWQRGAEELSILDKMIASPGVLNGLIRRLSDTYEKTPNRTLIALLKYPELDAYLPGLITAAKNPSVRAIAAGSLIAAQARWPIGMQYEWVDKIAGIQKLVARYETRPIDSVMAKDDLIAQTAADRSAQVRKVAMQALIDAPDLWQRRRALIDTLAKDRSAAIRAGIDHILRQPAKSR